MSECKLLTRDQVLLGLNCAAHDVRMSTPDKTAELIRKQSATIEALAKALLALVSLDIGDEVTHRECMICGAYRWPMTEDHDTNCQGEDAMRLLRELGWLERT